MYILTKEQLSEATRYNANFIGFLIDYACSATICFTYTFTSRNFANEVAIFQVNNRLTVDGKFGPNTQQYTNPKHSQVLYLDELPRRGIASRLCLDGVFIRSCQDQGLFGRIMLLVCSYDADNNRMTKRPGDFFGLDGTTLGWPHFAASTLRRYIEYIVNEHYYIVDALLNNKARLQNPNQHLVHSLATNNKIKLLESSSWRKQNIKDSPHNQGLFTELWWRQFCIGVVHHPILRKAQDIVWKENIFNTGLSYFQSIGLTSELGLAMCVRWRNSGSMSLYIRQRAKSKKNTYGEAVAIKYLQEQYVKNKPNRQSRIELMNKCFSALSTARL